ncbi:hypothetical protein DIJ64_13580 [Mycobacterium leprae]|uniref:Uncharacterized protein n=1 Tax=Mycobacterium leprae TaxID=1769 RepID=A0AAD0KXB6_MYCLR|nr:hypothetical protein DIJ64_13580 [Mycobacterium leprae]OAR19705.1 hypothetical protein A8144_13640 [Mycobacterium leprae 3125609]OAX70155.1 hypothetical protein A3216_13600 [Mycobacterium leprae 7935681]
MFTKRIWQNHFVRHEGYQWGTKLTDKEAVFSRDGVLQQFDKPVRLLSELANELMAKYRTQPLAIRWLQLIDATVLAAARYRTNPCARPRRSWQHTTSGRLYASRQRGLAVELYRQLKACGGTVPACSCPTVSVLFQPFGNLS